MLESCRHCSGRACRSHVDTVVGGQCRSMVMHGRWRLLKERHLRKEWVGGQCRSMVTHWRWRLLKERHLQKEWVGGQCRSMVTHRRWRLLKERSTQKYLKKMSYRILGGEGDIIITTLCTHLLNLFCISQVTLFPPPGAHGDAVVRL